MFKVVHNGQCAGNVCYNGPKPKKKLCVVADCTTMQNRNKCKRYHHTCFWDNGACIRKASHAVVCASANGTTQKQCQRHTKSHTGMKCVFFQGIYTEENPGHTITCDMFD